MHHASSSVYLQACILSSGVTVIIYTHVWNIFNEICVNSYISVNDIGCGNVHWCFLYSKTLGELSTLLTYLFICRYGANKCMMCYWWHDDTEHSVKLTTSVKTNNHLSRKQKGRCHMSVDITSANMCRIMMTSPYGSSRFGRRTKIYPTRMCFVLIIFWHGGTFTKCGPCEQGIRFWLLQVVCMYMRKLHSTSASFGLKILAWSIR